MAAADQQVKRFVVRYTGEPDYYRQYRGQFVKSGGGITPHLSQANVVGWTAASHSRWDDPAYELVEVKVVLA